MSSVNRNSNRASASISLDNRIDPSISLDTTDEPSGSLIVPPLGDLSSERDKNSPKDRRLSTSKDRKKVKKPSESKSSMDSPPSLPYVVDHRLPVEEEPPMSAQTSEFTRFCFYLNFPV